jgi:hypothetical protein
MGMSRLKVTVYTIFKKGIYFLWEPTEHKQDDSLVGRQRTVRTITCDSLLDPLL